MKHSYQLDAETLRLLRAAGIDTTGLTGHANAAERDSKIVPSLKIDYLNLNKIRPTNIIPELSESHLEPRKQEFESPFFERLERQKDDLLADLKSRLRGLDEERQRLADRRAAALKRLNVDSSDAGLSSKHDEYLIAKLVDKPKRSQPDWILQLDTDLKAPIAEQDFKNPMMKKKIMHSDSNLYEFIPKREEYPSYPAPAPSTLRGVDMPLGLNLLKHTLSEPIGYSQRLSKPSHESVDDVLAGLRLELRPFLYNLVQDSRVVDIAMKIVQNPRFVDIEARKIAPITISNPESIAANRYEHVVAGALADAMSDSAFCLGLSFISARSPKSRTIDSIEAVREQINKVDFCPAQIRGIIAHGRVRDAYIASVAERAEQLGREQYRF